MRLSANLGLLWPDLPLPARVDAAAAAGFDAVEMHWPQDDDVAAVAEALARTGLPMICLNTARGGPGAFGLAALPGRAAEARAETRRALACARRLGARAVHVMAGLTDGGPAAEAAFRAELAEACADAGGLAILIEPLNAADVPGYHLPAVDRALETIAAVDRPELRLMFDLYHAARTHGIAAVPALFARARDLVGHVQMAGAPDRGPPGPDMIALLRALDWPGEVGAEYRPGGPTDDTLGWMDAARGHAR